VHRIEDRHFRVGVEFGGECCFKSGHDERREVIKMVTVEAEALELIPAEFDDQDFGLLPCTVTCGGGRPTCVCSAETWITFTG